MTRGVWELSTPRLEHLRLVLRRKGDAPCTELTLQSGGFAGMEAPAVAMLVGMPARYAATLIDAVLAERSVNPRAHLDLVWSGPDTDKAQSRDTSEVLRELFAAVEQRVIIAGFAFWGASTIFETLYQRARSRSLEIEFFIHLDPTGQNQQMTRANFFRYTWPWTDIVPHVYYDARADGDDEQGSMHAKCVIVDEATTFITSANFTAAAQTKNVELGVLIRDTLFAKRVAAHWRSLAGCQRFLRL